MKRFFTFSSPEAKAGALISPVVRNVVSEIRSMGEVLGGFGNPVDFAELEQNALVSLTGIERLIAEGSIDPSAAVRHSAESRRRRPVDRELRVGVFPRPRTLSTGGHLLGGLIAMERFHLDKVIFVIAGRDFRKPDMASKNIRHSIAKKLLGLFDPLFEYCSTAFSTGVSGEENLFRILTMNPETGHSRLLHRRWRSLSPVQSRDRKS